MLMADENPSSGAGRIYLFFLGGEGGYKEAHKAESADIAQLRIKT